MALCSDFLTFSQFKRRIEFLDTIDSIDSITYQSYENDNFIVLVKINQMFYTVGFIDSLDNSLRISGELISDCSMLDDVNLTAQNFYELDTIEAIEYMEKTLRMLMSLQDLYSEFNIRPRNRKLEIEHCL